MTPRPDPRKVAQITFEDALLRLDRAGEHLADLGPRIEEFAKRQERKVVPQIEGTRAVLRELERVEDPPRLLSVIIGEILHNLRSALDYLVYALAWLDSGEHHEMTQFVIVDQPDEFDRKASGQLKGLSSGHVEAIKGWQPFNGHGWAHDLREASNQDKHRALNLAIVGGAGTVQAIRDEAGEVTGQRLQETIEVTFQNGPSVIAALTALQAGVREVLEAFRSELP